MKKNILLLFTMLFLVACETGTRYDKNATTQKVPKKEILSGVVKHNDFEVLLEDEEPLDEEEPLNDVEAWIDPEVKEAGETNEEEVHSFSNRESVEGLELRAIRTGKHDGYMRLVLDVYNHQNIAQEVGHYDANYYPSRDEISVILHDYQKFSASLPSFARNEIIESIHFDKYPKDRGLKFHIKLRQNAKVKIFDLKNPARLVFDIKAI